MLDLGYEPRLFRVFFWPDCLFFPPQGVTVTPSTLSSLCLRTFRAFFSLCHLQVYFWNKWNIYWEVNVNLVLKRKFLNDSWDIFFFQNEVDLMIHFRSPRITGQGGRLLTESQPGSKSKIRSQITGTKQTVAPTLEFMRFCRRRIC